MIKHHVTEYRAEVAETVRFMTLLTPRITFSIMSAWLEDRIKRSTTIPTEISTPNSPDYLEWEAITSFMENIMARLSMSEQEKPPIDEGLRLAKAVLYFETKDPMILSCVMSCMSALSPYITSDTELLTTMLNKVFSAVVFTLEGQTKATRSRAVKNVRRHACSAIVKVCKSYSKVLLQMFDLLYEHVKRLSSDPLQLSQMEKVTLMEALVLISNEFKDFEKQSAFCGEVLEDVKKMWLSDELKETLTTVRKFIHFVGIDSPPIEASTADACGIKRSQIIFCVTSVLAVMKRSRWPDNPDDAKHGGFVGDVAGGRAVNRNPAFPHVGVMLQNVLYFLKTHNALWLPEHLDLRHPKYASIYEPNMGDRLAILGMIPPPVSDYEGPVNKDPLDRMYNFLNSSYESCYQILGNAGACLGLQFYALPNLAQFIRSTVFTNLDVLPNYRLRPILRFFLKPYISDCPKEVYSVAVLPLLADMCPFLLERLDSQWKAINQRVESLGASGEEEDPESQQVLEDHLVHLLTRDYIDLIATVCRRHNTSSIPEASDDATMEDGETGETTAIPAATPQPGTKDDTLSDLGQLALASEAIAPSMIVSVFNGLKWGDGPSCIRCATVAIPILKYMVVEKRLSGADVSSLYTAILQGLLEHGEHDGCYSSLITLALQAYELLHADFNEVAEVLLQIPNNTVQSIKSFDDKIRNGMTEKKKREHFKKLVEEVTGKSISTRFQKVSEIKDLPPLLRKARAKPLPLDVTENADIGLCALFTPDEASNHR